MKRILVYTIMKNGERIPTGIADSNEGAEALIDYVKKMLGQEEVYSFEIVENATEEELNQIGMKSDAKKQKKGKEEIMLSIRDELLLNDDIEGRDDYLKYIEEELDLLYEKGKIKDPVRFINKAFSASGSH